MTEDVINFRTFDQAAPEEKKVLKRNASASSLGIRSNKHNFNGSFVSNSSKKFNAMTRIDELN